MSGSHYPISTVLAGTAVLTLGMIGGCPPVPGGPSQPLPLSAVRTWAYQIQELHAPGAVEALAASSYDLLVIEPTRTDYSSPEVRRFDTAAAVAQLKASPAGDGLHRKLVIAYIDIGQAENWRWYWDWSEDWSPGQPRPADWPEWILTPDPDGWAGNFVVKFWEAAWQDIVIHGRNQLAAADRDFVSTLDEVLQDGFDGVYLDWVEAYSDDTANAAAEAANVDAAAAMVDFIAAIRAYGQARRPGFIVIQQNAAALIEDAPTIVGVVDAIAQEDTWYGGQADCDWERSCGYDVPQSAQETTEILQLLDSYRAAGKAVFTVDYTVARAAEVYADATARGYVPYCSRTALSRLTTTPPPGK
jgi:cysteinyl-tRNA synthetase